MVRGLLVTDVVRGLHRVTDMVRGLLVADVVRGLLRVTDMVRGLWVADSCRMEFPAGIFNTSNFVLQVFISNTTVYYTDIYYVVCSV